MSEKKGAIPSEAIENGVSHSLIHPAAAGAGLSGEKEVEDLARAMCSFSKNTLCRECSDACFYKDYAKRAIDKGWRKQSEGYWFFTEYEYFTCSNCGKSHFNFCDSSAEARKRLAEGEYYPYCPECGAEMKDGAE